MKNVVAKVTGLGNANVLGDGARRLLRLQHWCQSDMRALPIIRDRRAGDLRRHPFRAAAVVAGLGRRALLRGDAGARGKSVAVALPASSSRRTVGPRQRAVGRLPNMVPLKDMPALLERLDRLRPHR